MGLGFFSLFLAARKSDFLFRLSRNDGNGEYCASCTRPYASCKGRGVSRYELSLGLWDSSSTRSLRTLFFAVRRFLIVRSDGVVGFFLAICALGCLERQKERTHVHMSPTFLVKAGLILPRVRARL